MRIIRKILAIISLFSVFTTPLTVGAEDLYSARWPGTGMSDNNDPLSWDQCNWPYSAEPYPPWALIDGDTWCGSACGAHALTWVVLKAGLLKQGEGPMDLWKGVENDGDWSGWLYPGSGGIMFSGSTKVRGKEVKLVDQYSGGFNDAREFVVSRYNKGYYVVINPEGHYGALDYVNSDGNVLVLDSAGHRCKYYECLASKWGSTIHIYALEIEGAPKANASNAIRLWDGDAAMSGDTGDNNNNSGGSNTYTGEAAYGYSDPFEALDNPLVKYEENQSRGVSNKGIDTRRNTIWG